MCVSVKTFEGFIVDGQQRSFFRYQRTLVDDSRGKKMRVCLLSLCLVSLFALASNPALSQRVRRPAHQNKEKVNDNKNKKPETPANFNAAEFAAELADTTDNDEQAKKGWQRIGSSTRYYYYFNPVRVTALTSSIKSAWFKERLRYPFDKNKTAIINDRKSHRLVTTDYDDYRETLLLMEFNCGSSESRTISYTDYTDKGDVLDSEQLGIADWSHVVPDSIGEEMFKSVCGK